MAGKKQQRQGLVEADPADRVARSRSGYRIDAPGSQRASGKTSTQWAAEQRAKEIVRNLGGGEVTTRGKDGRIKDSDTVRPGRDPFPPRDKKH